MKFENALDNIHAKVTSVPLLQLFTAFTRILLAVGFTPPSIKKILHQPFTSLPDSNPVGHYFNALYETGFYYEFIGWAQLIAAILLLFPRTAHYGALLFFPIILNIAVLTSSVGFAGTNYITALMFTASLYLVCWDYDRLKPLFFAGREIKKGLSVKVLLAVSSLFAVGGTAAALFAISIGLANVHRYPAKTIIGLTIGGFVFGLLCAVHYSFMRSGKLKVSEALS
jgi:hypothetical protein